MSNVCKKCGTETCACGQTKDGADLCPSSLEPGCSWKKRSCYPIKGLLMGLAIAIGPMMGGYFVAQSLKSPKSHDRFLTVNIEVEKETKADYVIWRLGFQNTGNDIKALQEKYVRDRELIFAFLKKRGFKDDEISIGSPKITDQLTNRFEKATEITKEVRYILNARIKVSTSNVIGVTDAAKETNLLLTDGVMLVDGADRWSRETNPRYFLKDQTKIEHDLYGEAMAKAIALSQQLSQQMNVKITGLRSTEQQQPLQIQGQGQGGGYEGSMDRLRGPVKRAQLQMSYKFNIE